MAEDPWGQSCLRPATLRASLVAQTVKSPAMWETRFDPWVGKIPWKRRWLPIPVLLAGKSRGQGSLAGYSPWGCTESDTIEHLLFLVSFPSYANGGILSGGHHWAAACCRRKSENRIYELLTPPATTTVCTLAFLA